MSFDFSTLVTDRAQADVSRVKQIAEKIKNGTASESELAEFNSAAMKGAYNYTDLNRVTAAMEALKAKLEGYGYSVPGYQRIKVPHVLPEPEPTSRLPEGYLELAWIESTGTQYIDSGVRAKSGISVDVVWEFTDTSITTQGIVSARGGAEKRMYHVYINSARWTHGYGALFTSGVAPSVGVKYEIQSDLSVGVQSLVVNGNTVYSRTDSTDQGIDCNYFVFATNYPTGTPATRDFAYGKMYSCKMYDNGTIVRDFIPCINSDGEVGLYDLVTAAFFGNSGTGSFVSGAVPRELPEGYTQVEYIESTPSTYTAGQRIDTGFTPNSNTRVVCDFQFTKTTSSFQALLGSRSSSANRFCLWLTNGGLFRSDYNTSNLSFSSSLSATERHTLDFNKNVCSIDTSVVTHSAGSFNGVCNLFLFASDTDGSADIHGNVRIYSCHIYDNGTLVRDFVPCKNSSGVFGLYDMVNDTFYQNAGSGAFSAGEEVVAPATASVMVVSGNADEYDPYTWYEFDWPTTETMTVYLLNVSAIRAVLAVLRSTPEVPTDMERLMTRDANDIEAILLDVYRQLTIMPTTFIPCGEALCGGDNL